jgi:hypothetical protein
MTRSDTFALSGAECALALRQLGFDVVHREPGRTLLQRRRHLVIVPDVLVLPASVLDAIIEGADVSYEALLSAVEDAPTQTELRCVDL